MIDLSDLPCGSCAHMAQVFDDGRVLCQGIYVNIPKRVKTWRITEPHIWGMRPNGQRYAKCYDYEKAKGQMKLEVGE